MVTTVLRVKYKRKKISTSSSNSVSIFTLYHIIFCSSSKCFISFQDVPHARHGGGRYPLTPRRHLHPGFRLLPSSPSHSDALVTSLYDLLVHSVNQPNTNTPSLSWRDHAAFTPNVLCNRRKGSRPPTFMAYKLLEGYRHKYNESGRSSPDLYSAITTGMHLGFAEYDSK